MKRFLPAAPYVVIVILSVAFTSLFVSHYPRLGPVDEQAHVDYLYKINDGHLPRVREKLGQDVLHIEACRGFDSPYSPPACGERGTYEPKAFQFEGEATAAVYPPLYYVVTAVVATPIKLVTGLSLFTAARVASGLWLAAALSLLWWTARRMGASAFAAAPILALLSVTPSVVYASGTISPDASSLFSGALVLAGVLQFRHRPGLLFTIGALVMLLKGTNLILVLVGFAALLILSWTGDHWWPREDRRATWRARLLPAFALSSGGAITAIGWSVISNVRALPGGTFDPTGGAVTFAGSAFAFLSPVAAPSAASILYNKNGIQYALSTTNFLWVAGAVAAAFLFRFRTWQGALGWVSLVAMLIGPLVVAYSIRATGAGLYDPPPRYGLSLMPFIIFPLMVLVTSRVARGFLIVAAVGLVVLTGRVINASDLEIVQPKRDLTLGT